MGAILVILALGSFYTYRKIENLDFIVKQNTLSQKDKFFEEFGISTIESDLLIREILAGTRTSLNATQASIWGYHNGVKIGPFPFRRMSILDESVKRGYKRLSTGYQNIPLGIYIEMTEKIWDSDRYATFINDGSEAGDVYSLLNENDYGYMFAYSINIQNYDAPIGFFAVFLSKERAEEIMECKGCLEALEIESYAAGKRIEMVFNMQYNRLLLDGE